MLRKIICLVRIQYKSTKPSESAGSGPVLIDPNEVAVMKLRIIPTSEGYYDALINQYIYNWSCVRFSDKIIFIFN